MEEDKTQILHSYTHRPIKNNTFYHLTVGDNPLRDLVKGTLNTVHHSRFLPLFTADYHFLTTEKPDGTLEKIGTNMRIGCAYKTQNPIDHSTIGINKKMYALRIKRI